MAKKKTEHELSVFFPALIFVLSGCPDYDAKCVKSFCSAFGFSKRAVVQMMKERCLIPNNTTH
jgi:hypothetical protein